MSVDTEVKLDRARIEGFANIQEDRLHPDVLGILQISYHSRHLSFTHLTPQRIQHVYKIHSSALLFLKSLDISVTKHRRSRR